MSFEFIKKLPTPAEIKEEYPLPAELVKIKEARDAEIRDVITGKSNKFLVIIGPAPQTMKIPYVIMSIALQK